MSAVSSTLHVSQPPVPALEIQTLRLYCTLLDEDRTQQLLDFAQKLIEEQREERGTTASVLQRDSEATA